MPWYRYTVEIHDNKTALERHTVNAYDDRRALRAALAKSDYAGKITSARILGDPVALEKRQRKRDLAWKASQEPDPWDITITYK